MQIKELFSEATRLYDRYIIGSSSTRIIEIRPEFSEKNFKEVESEDSAGSTIQEMHQTILSLSPNLELSALHRAFLSRSTILGEAVYLAATRGLLRRSTSR